MVIRAKGGFKIKSHQTGRVYPKVYPTKEAAKARIRQMLMFKRRK